MNLLNFSKVHCQSIGLKPVISLSSLLTIIATIVASVGTANAATLSELNIGGTLDIESLGDFFETSNPLVPIGLDPNDPNARKAPITSFDFDDIGRRANNGSGEFTILGGTEEFALVNPPPSTAGTIKDLPPFPTSNNRIPDFLDLAFDANSGSGLEFNVDFDLTQFTQIDYIDTNIGVIAGASVVGEWNFKDANDNIIDTKPGTGTISADITYDSIPEVSNFEEFISFISVEGNRIETLTLSGDFILEDEDELPPDPQNPNPIPESSSIISLVTFGLAGAGFLASKQKRAKISSHNV